MAKHNLLANKPGDREGDCTCQEVRAGGRFQLWKSDSGDWGVFEVDIINNRYKTHLGCNNLESDARSVFNILAPIGNER